MSGRFDPKPLRSDDEPDGLSTLLEGKKLERVTAANKLYQFVAEFVELFDSKGISWSVDYPGNRYMWKTSWFKKLLQKSNVKYRWLHTQMCMQGGKRDKWTSLLHGGKVSLVGGGKSL